jgi:hypothetical protein|tara:strand:- start:249 stop:1106 length:858 start_codon:yes stop_codon:yes gene_type:complete
LKLTNNYGAPDSIVDAVRNDPYTKDGADFSVTELIKPPQIRRLWNKHEDDITVDVREQIWKLLGTGVHAAIEQADSEGTKEQRFHAEHTTSIPPYSVTISGAIDLIRDDGSIVDYKVTSTYSVQRGLKEDWEKQLNLYAWLLRQNDITATKLSIVCICRDWMKSRVGKYDYPNSPVVVLSVPMWRDGRQDDYVDQRVRVHVRESTIPCTPEERWARGAYQVNPTHSGGGKPRSFDTMREATDYVNKQKTGSYNIVDGDAKYVRCEGWCEVAEFCPQWKGGRGNGS